MISMLLTSCLEWISMGTNHTIPWVHFKDSFSSVILCCRPSFMEYNSPVPLSNTALNHLNHLNHLHTWCIQSSTYLFCFISAPCFPTPQGTFTLEGCCMWMASTVETFRGRCFHHARRNTIVQGEGIAENSEHHGHVRYQH